MKKVKVLYLFKPGRQERISQLAHCKMPDDFFYGFPHMKSEGYQVDIIEETPSPARVNSLKNQMALLKESLLLKMGLSTPLFVSIFNGAFIHIMEELNKYDYIITTTDSIGLTMAYYKKKKRLTPSIIFIEMGLSDQLYSMRERNHFAFTLRKPFIKKLLKECKKIISLGKGSFYFFEKEFEPINKHFEFIPFGVDVNFWGEGPDTTNNRRGVLFIGNDLNRDFSLVVQIARTLKEIKFKFVTSRLHEDEMPKNVELIKGDWRNSLLTDKEVRNLYYESSFVIVPLKDSLQPSGQSVALQAMACGKAVILTRTRGLWEPEYMLHGENCWLVEPNNPEQLSEAIRHLGNNPKEVKRLGNNAKRLVELRYKSKDFALGMEACITDTIEKGS